MDVQRVIYVLRAIGLKGIVRTIRYGFTRDRIDKQYSRKKEHAEKCLPGVLTKSTPIKGGLKLEYEHAQAELLFLKPELVRISWEPGRSPVQYTIAKTDWKIIQPQIYISPSETKITSENLIITIDDNGGIEFKDGKGNLFKKDNLPFRQGDKWTLSTKLAPEEHVYGLGERASKLNLRPGIYSGWNTDPGGRYSPGKDPLYICTPVYLSVSNAGYYLVYFENSHQATFQIGNDFEASFSGGMLRYYVISGAFDQIFSDLAELTGHPFMPPKWALGYHQSRWSYGSEVEIRSVIQGFKEHDLPISAIHLDIDYMDGFRIFTFNHQRFPNPKRLINDLDEEGVKVVASINPAVKRDTGYKVYTVGLAHDIYCKQPDGKIFIGTSWSGWSTFPDFTRPVARLWWKEQYNSLTEVGISGIWHDMNEPASFAAWGDKSFPRPTIHSMDSLGGDHNEAHNIYGLLMNQAGYEALKEYSPSKRPWILSRSGWAGMQRFAWNWSGDVETSWESLAQTIPTILAYFFRGRYRWLQW
jgi:alpha-glucosidase